MKCTFATLPGWLVAIAVSTTVVLANPVDRPASAAPPAAEKQIPELVPIHDGQSKALVGYVDMQEQEVFDIRRQYIGSWDDKGTYDASGNQVLDKPLPGILLSQGTAAAAVDESRSTLAIPDGRLLNRVVIEQVPVATEILQEPITPRIGHPGRALTEAERAELAARRKLVLEKKAAHKVHAKPKAKNPTDTADKDGWQKKTAEKKQHNKQAQLKKETAR